MTTIEIQAEISRVAAKMAAADPSSQKYHIYSDIIKELKASIPSKVNLYKAEDAACESCQ